MGLILLGAFFTNNPIGFEKKALEKTELDFTTKEMIKTSKFKITWIMFWFAVIPGLLVLGAAKDIGLEVAGLEATAAAGVISILALSNAGSRLVSGSLSDRFGVLNVLKAIFVITIVSLLGLSFFAHMSLVFYMSAIGVAVGYGGFLSLFPVYTNQEFGSYRYASNYGVVYQAYGIAALSGIFIKRFAGTYSTTFMISAIAACIGLGLAFMLKERNRESKKAKKMTTCAEKA